MADPNLQDALEKYERTLDALDELVGIQTLKVEAVTTQTLPQNTENQTSTELLVANQAPSSPPDNQEPSIADSSNKYKEQYSNSVLAVLEARDQIEEFKAKEKLNRTCLNKLDKLDKHLRKHAGTIAQTLEEEPLLRCFQPRQASWWWNLERPPSRCNLLLEVLTVFFWIAFIALSSNFLPRFFAGGLDVTSTLTATITAAGSLLSLEKAQQSLQTLKHTLEKSRIGQRAPDKTILYLSFGLSTFMAFATWRMYAVSEIFYWRGEQRIQGINGFNHSELSIAESDFKRAIAFNPNHAEAHTRLGWLYELQQQPEEAIKEYKIAVRNGSIRSSAKLARIQLFAEEKQSPVQVANSTLILLDRSQAKLEDNSNSQKNSDLWMRFSDGFTANVTQPLTNISRDLFVFIGLDDQSFKNERTVQSKEDRYQWSVIRAWTFINQAENSDINSQKLEKAIRLLKLNEDTGTDQRKKLISGNAKLPLDPAQKKVVDQRQEDAQQLLEEINESTDYYLEQAEIYLNKADQLQKEVESARDQQKDYSPPATAQCLRAKWQDVKGVLSDDAWINCYELAQRLTPEEAVWIEISRKKFEQLNKSIPVTDPEKAKP